MGSGTNVLEMVMGSRKSIDNSAMVGSMVGGGAMGLMGPACTSLGATMMAGGVSGATGDIAAQAYRTKGGPINAKEVADLQREEHYLLARVMA